MNGTHPLAALGPTGEQRGLPASGGAKSASGFTMIEVLVVVSILGILLAIAIPGFAHWLPKYRLNGATRDFYSNLQLAKSLAIRDRANSVISFSNNSYSVSRNGTTFKTMNLDDYGSGISFADGSTTDNIEFTPMGMTGNSVEVFVKITNNRAALRTIRIYPSGVANLEN